MESLKVQVGGTHYKGLKYQPVQLAANADLNFFQANIVKYITREKNKDGLKDLHKVIHYAELGFDLNPTNHVRHVGIKELCRFVRENDLSPEIGNILYQTFHQNWLSVVSLTNLYIQREYGEESPKE